LQSTVDVTAADWIEESLRFSKGRWYGSAFKLQPWQRTIVNDLLHTYQPDGLRQHRTAYVSVPRKQGKTEMFAALGLYWLFVAGEPGSEIYSVAGDADQASIAFDAAKRMVEQNPAMEAACKVYRRSIVRPDTGAHYKVLSSDHAGKHGYSPDLVLFDELHVQKNRELWDVMRTGMGARQHPLLAAVTTAGIFDKTSIAWEIYDYACQVRDGTIQDPSFYTAIWEADRDADWTAPEVWRAANPNLGVSVSESFLEQECAVAKETPSYQNSFRRLYLNQWTQQTERWVDVAKWNECAGDVDAEELAGHRCYAGLDLASTTDITALVLYFPDSHKVLPWFWVPEDTIKERSRKDQVQYAEWSRRGFMVATPGNVTDYRYILEQIVAISKKYKLQEVWYDPWNGEQLAVQLAEDHGVNTIQCRQGFASMNGPSKAFERLYWSGELIHGSQPVMDWMIGNATCKRDPSDNIKPDKSTATDKIDGVVAMIMAIGAAGTGIDHTSIYETRGPIEVSW